MNPHNRFSNIEILKTPGFIADGANSTKILAIANDEYQADKIPVATVDTNVRRVKMLGEFSGALTGEYAPANIVCATVYDSEVYKKVVSTDMPLSGLRTAIAQRRAARKARAKL